MPTAVTHVAAVWRSGHGILGSADGLFDDEQHTHECHDRECCSGDANHDHGRHQPKGRQHAPEPRKPEPSDVFTGLCGVGVHDCSAVPSDAWALLDSVRWTLVSEEAKYG